MIYLIGGAPRVGKSILAQNIGVSCLSTDTLCTEDTDMQFSQVMHLGTEKIVEIQLSKARSMTRPLEQFIESQLETQTDFILEGVHLLPSLVSNFHKKCDIDMRSIFVVSLDRELVLSGLRSDTREQNWMRSASDEMQEAMADFVVEYSTELKSQAEKENLSAFERTGSFQNDIDTILGLLQKR